MATDGSIEPDSFDVIVVGTGLQEAMLAAAAAASRRLSVLHLDSHEFYGAHWTSFDFNQFTSWATSGGRFSVPSQPSPFPSEEFAGPPQEKEVNVVHDLDDGSSVTDLSSGEIRVSASGPGLDHSVGEEEFIEKNGTLSVGKEEFKRDGRGEAPVLSEEREFEEIKLESGKEGLFSGFEVFEYEGLSLGPSRSYSIDLCGPRLTFCGSNLVNMLLRSGASHYLEFKGVDASYIWTGEAGGISAVPSSRADVFKDKALSLSDKRFLMRFFKLVTDYAQASSDEQQQQFSADISAEDLDAPFLNFMQRQRLPTSIQSIIFYAIALVDEDQQGDVNDSSALLKTRDGLQKLALYLTSVARFPNASGAFLYPLYGQGELPQAFCRSAAVNGALYVLRRPVRSLLLDQVSKEYKGVRTLQGQVLFSKRLILGPSVLPATGACVDLSFARSDDQSEEATHQISLDSGATAFPGERVGFQVARCVCITDRSLCEGQSTLLVIFPPRSVHEKGSHAIRALQLSSAASVCPEDKYIVQLSTICTNETDGRKALEAAVQALFASSHDREAKNSETDSVLTVDDKPNLLWSSFYVQALHTTVKGLNIPGVTFCSMPDGTLDGERFLQETEKLFREMFPDEDFFPQSVASKDAGEDDDSQET
ncbi:unnamed protein product [Calypogeia fissa]